MMNATKKQPEITRHSRLFSRGPIDGRSRSGRYLARCRAELRRHLGSEPSPVQLALTERIAMLQLRLMMLDERVATGAALSATEEKSYASLNSALARMMRELGIKAAAPKALTARQLMGLDPMPGVAA